MGFTFTFPLLPTNSELGIVECCMLSSSGSTSSRSLSAALSACSARALRASSTTGCPAVVSNDPEDNALDASGEKELPCELDLRRATGEGYFSNAAENDIRFTEWSMLSESLSLPGIGTVWASSKDSSSMCG